MIEIYIIANEIAVDKDYIPSEGDNIKIIVKSYTYGSAFASVHVPKAPKIASIKCKPSIISISNDLSKEDLEMDTRIDFNLYIELEVEDTDKNMNFYKFDYCQVPSNELPLATGQSVITEPKQGVMFDIGKFEGSLESTLNDHVGFFDYIIDSQVAEGFYIVTDASFEKQRCLLHLSFMNGYYQVKSNTYDESLLNCGLHLQIYSISESYYNGIVDRWQQEAGMQGTLTDLGLQETFGGYSNVSTGAGIVAAQTKKTYQVNLKDFLKENME